MDDMASKWAANLTRGSIWEGGEGGGRWREGEKGGVKGRGEGRGEGVDGGMGGGE